MGKWEVDTDMMIDILKKGQPLSMGAIQDDDTGKDKLVVLFALPKLSEQIRAFAEKLLNEEKGGKDE